MGNYNPRSAVILGEEWVPIRDENVVFSPAVNSVEWGHTFDLATSRQARDARFYVNELPPPAVAYQTALFGIYPYGTEDQSGPIREVIIPCSSGGVTGTGLAISGGTTVQEVLALPGDGKFILADASGGAIVTQLVMFFNTPAYSQLLNDKRILNVSLLYVGYAFDANSSGTEIPFVDPDTSTPATVFRLTNDSASQAVTYTRFLGAPTGSLWQLNTTLQAASNSSAYGAQLGTLNLGDVNLWWSVAAPPTFSAVDMMPYRYADLLRFNEASANRINSRIRFQVPTNNGANTQIRLDYFAMRVIYCEEQRVVYGARRNGFGSLNYGANPVTLRNLAHTADPILPAGKYLATLSWVNPGDIDFGAGTVSEFPGLNGLRQLYEIPSHEGVKVNIPAPLSEHLGETFTRDVTMVLPQLSIHASGGALTEPHVYGRQVAAQVYGVNTATQDIYDDISGTNASYPQVRFYARRYGDTTIPLTLTGVGAFSASAVSITVSDFDDLAEIIDGWREVTLRFSTAPTMGAAAGFPAWTWSAASETKGNRWEILGASAPAISGIPGNLFNLATQQLASGTYQPTSGATVELTWMPQGVGSPYVSGASADQTSDAVLIFSQDPPTITGVGLSTLTQVVSGYALDCGSLPCCIPSGISYNQITWAQQGALSSSAPDILDTFSRTESNGFGTADTGQTWVNSLVSAGTAAQISVNGSSGLHTPTGIPLAILNTIGGQMADVDITTTASASASSASAEVSIIARFTDTNNYYRLVYNITANTLSIVRVLAGVSSTLATGAAAGTTTAAFRMRFMLKGTSLFGKAWLVTDAEPAAWTLSTTDTSLLSGTVGLLSYQDTASKTYTFDNFAVVNSTVGTFGAYEMQRWDAEQPDFETIMLATDPTLTSFNDYEARVGITSVYRIRALNVLNFAGAWSTYVSGAPPAPGVSGAATCDQTGALIFTSNADQTGALNAAYVMQWDGTPTEDFALPEADMVTYQPRYGVDGSVAFHGTERGLERFSRAVLLHAAAIDPIRLADASTIRDLAWDDLPYVCVRDDIGDRWFANVRVPTVNARNNRTRYMARIDIVETNVEPYPVDP